MSGVLSRAAAAGLVVSCVVACTLTTDLDGFAGGAGAIDGGLPDTSTPTNDSGGNGLAPDGSSVCDPTGCVAVPAGFNLVAYGPKSAVCPNNFTKPFDGVESPSVAGG